jgi:hypothetical protein
MSTDDKKEHSGEKSEISDLKHEVEELREEVLELEEEIIDLEEWAKENKPPKKAKKYVIRIDKTKYTVEVHEMTGTQILALAGKTPDKYQLSQKFRGGRVEVVQPNQTVEFHKHQVERFQTLALDPTEG